MILTHTKIKTFILSAVALVAMSGCGSTGSSSDTTLVEGSVQGEALYEIPAHHGTTAVVHSHAEVTETHEWTQTSGPTVVLSTKTASTTILVVPTTTTPITLQHKTTNTQTGVTTVTPHTIIPIPPQPSAPLDVVIGKPRVVFSGDIGSLHASAFGGTAPYSYMWIAPSNITLDESNPNAPLFVAPQVTTTEVINVGLQVVDHNGDTVTSNEIITVTQKGLIIDPRSATQTINSNTSKNKNGPHAVSSAPFTITNPISTESYTWTAKTLSTNQNPLVDLKMVLIISIDSTRASISFRSPDVTASTTYSVIVRAQNSKGDRIGDAKHEFTINP